MHLRLKTKFVFLWGSCGFVHVGCPLWREDGSVVYNCYWFLPAQSFTGPSLVGLVTICRAPSATHDQIFITIWQLWSCFCAAPSLTRGQLRLFYMLLTLASVVFLVSESLGTRDHILPSQISDFPFRRLLRLAGSRWRYSKFSHGCPHGVASVVHLTTPLHGPSRKHRFQQYLCCMLSRCRGNMSTELFPSSSLLLLSPPYGRFL
jgi:hypothetical protein